jgi:hypothetical protein
MRPRIVAAMLVCWALAVGAQGNEKGNDPRPTPAASTVPLPVEKANPVVVPRLEAAPVVDGTLDEAAWRGAAVLRDFYQTNPGDNAAPSAPTEVLVGFTATHFYFAFRCKDDPSKVRANVAKRDQIWDDDYVGFYIDTFNDRRRAYELFFNPLGIQADGIFTEGGGEDFSLDLVMESKGRVTEDGYVVEVAVPFKSLRYEAGRDKHWGLHAYRRIKHRNNELDSWMPNDRNRGTVLSQAGRLTGLEGIDTERTVELIPSFTVSHSGNRVSAYGPAGPPPGVLDPGAFDDDGFDAEAGLTAKFMLTPSVTLDFAANPDFAQVEADQTVVTANQRFPIFFQEKRPFFLEGMDLFNDQLQTVHTRTIVDPDLAAKITGKRGRTSFGLMLASDAAPGSFSEEEMEDPGLADVIERFGGKNAHIGVLRLKRDVGDQSSLGMIATTYNFIERHNHVAGVDGRFQIDPKTVFTFEALGSNSRRHFYDPAADAVEYKTGNGFAYNWNLDYTSRNFGYYVNGRGRTREYRADVGFTPRTNTNYDELFLRFSNDPKQDRFLISWRLMNVSGIGFDWQGRSQQVNNGTRFNMQFRKQTFVQVGTDQGYERLFEEEFGPKRGPGQVGAFLGEDGERSTPYRSVFFVVESAPSQKFRGFLFMGTIRNAFDFDFGAGPRYPRVSPAALANPNAPLDPGPGRTFDVNGGLTFQPTSALQTSIEYTKARLTRNDTDRVAFDTNIFSLRSTYQFTRFAFVRARIDYDTLAAQARGQFLFGWTPSPGTAFYAGYNDDLNYNGFSPFTGHHEPGFRRNGRTFFVKMSYLLRMGM